MHKQREENQNVFAASAALLHPRGRLPQSVSVVIPCFNEELGLSQLKQRLDSVLKHLGLTYEVILVDDGSKDRTWAILQQFAEEDPNYRAIRMSRNYGHQLALTCGLDYAAGEVVLVLDADLQDPPELLPEMLAKWREGYDVVYGKRLAREGESRMKRFLAYGFYRLISRLVQLEIPEDTGDFRLLDSRALSALKQLREPHRFIRGMVSWIGFQQTPIYYRRPERFAGDSKYSFTKSLLLAADALTSFSRVPLRLASYLGAAISALLICFLVLAITLKILGITDVQGSTLLFASILLLGGVQLLALGIIGEYLGRIFEQGQARPLYIVEKVSGQFRVLPNEKRENAIS